MSKLVRLFLVTPLYPILYPSREKYRSQRHRFAAEVRIDRLFDNSLGKVYSES